MRVDFWKKLGVIYFILSFFAFNPVFASKPKEQIHVLGQPASLSDLRKYYQRITYSRNGKTGYIVEIPSTDTKYTTLSGYYDKDFNKIFEPEYDRIKFLDDSEYFHRFLILEQDERYALYDIKTKEMTGFDYEAIEASYGNTPMLYYGDEIKSLQPVKRVAGSTIHFAKETALFVVLIPVATVTGVVLLFCLFYNN